MSTVWRSDERSFARAVLPCPVYLFPIWNRSARLCRARRLTESDILETMQHSPHLHTADGWPGTWTRRCWWHRQQATSCTSLLRRGVNSRRRLMVFSFGPCDKPCRTAGSMALGSVPVQSVV